MIFNIAEKKLSCLVHLRSNLNPSASLPVLFRKRNWNDCIMSEEIFYQALRAL